MATKAKRKPYQPKIQGSMYFPMEFKGSDDEHIRQSTYKGLFATRRGQQIVYSQRRYYNVQLHFCVYDNGKQAKYDVIHLQINQPLFSIELSAFIQEQGIIERNRGDYDISKSMIYICLRKGQ